MTAHLNPFLGTSLRILSVTCAMALSFATAAPQTRLLVDLSERPEPLGLSAFDLCVLRVDAQVDLEAAHALGHQCLARVPLFEVAAHSPAVVLAQKLGVPLLEGSARGIFRLDATHPRWAHVLVHEQVETAAERGFNGVVLAGLETISQDAERAAVLGVLPLLKAAYPDKQIFLEGGYSLLHEARRYLDGILFIEEKDADKDDLARNERKIHEATRQGVQPYVVGFAKPGHAADVAPRASRIRELGGVPFFTTPELTGVNLGPLQETVRRVLVLHSGAAQTSYTARVLHGSLEWLGYQIVYHDASLEASAAWLPEHVTINAVILDQSLCLNLERQHSLVSLVTGLKSENVPLLITGQPWETASDWSQVATALDLKGSGKNIAKSGEAIIHQVENALLMNRGTIAPRTTGLREVRAASESSQILLSVRADSAVCDQIFLSSWGGFWLDPLAVEAGPQLDPLPFLERFLAAQDVTPVVDTTSLDGQRLLITHIEADGFAETSDQPGLPVAAEVMLEQVIDKYSLPMTVAVCEGDLRGWTPGQDPRQAMRLQEAARAIFALPSVEAASGGLSRPTSWEGRKPVGGTLNASAKNTPLMLEREVAGSLAFLHHQLLNPDRAMGLMSWPQDSFPSKEAVAFSRDMGVENLILQTQTTLAGRTPALSPRSWGISAQFSTLMTRSSLAQGTPEVEAFINEAHRTGQHRWLSPVQLSLSFHDAARASTLKQVERLLDWCASQPLQAVTAGHYARIMRDAARTRIFQTGHGSWIIVNEGFARTLRLPVTAGVPDLARCTGVSGFVRQGDQIYIHTLGLRRTDLVMRTEPEADYLRLATSSASVRYLEAGSRRALLQVAHTRPVEFAFEGMRPGTMCQMLANGLPEYHMADTEGRIEFIVPGQSTVQLRILPETPKAAMR
jgi:hypothetical protein